MSLQINTNRSPIADMDWSFGSYLNRRISENARHITGNAVPDYAYGMDYELRKKLDAIPGLYSLVTKMLVTELTNQLQTFNMYSLAVTPTQFSDVYDITCECARRLGIAVPNVFIVTEPKSFIKDMSEINAWTYCIDEIQPTIIITSAMYERFTTGELKAVIGHECGHIQNNHMVYDYIANMITNTGIVGIGARYPMLAAILSTSTAVALSSWSRAEEVTADRAGMICADDPEDAYRVNAKLMYGATFKEQEIDYASLEQQLKLEMGNINKYLTFTSSHPTSVRRIMAEREFAECAVFYDWRPDLKKPDSVFRSKEECDARCKTYINLMSDKGAKEK